MKNLTESAESPVMPAQMQHWLRAVTGDIAALVRTYPPGITEKLDPMLRVLAGTAGAATAAT